MRWLAGAAVLAAMAAAPVAAQTVRDGVEAWQRGDYDAAVRAWQPLARAGDGDAAFDLGQAYKLGRGVPIDLNQAKTFYGQAARAGHVQGAANYGLLQFQDGDRKAAMPWIIKASDAGDPRAQYVYGTALYNGDLAAKDWPRAYALMTRAAAAGLPQATTSLSQMDGLIPAADRQKGLKLASQLASQPVPPLGKTMVTGGSGQPTRTAAAAPLPPLPQAQAVSTPPAASRPIFPQDRDPDRTPVPLPPRAAAAPARPAPARPVPTAAQHAPAPSAAAAGGHWAVQLGAYGSDASARAAWTALAAKAPALHGLQPRYEKAGAVTRLRAAGLADRAAADRACAAAKAAGAACFPVAP